LIKTILISLSDFEKLKSCVLAIDAVAVIKKNNKQCLIILIFFAKNYEKACGCLRNEEKRFTKSGNF
jgi:hypothetical protein